MMARIVSLREARRLMNNLHPTILRALVALVAGYGVDSSTKLSSCLSVSDRNSRRIVSVLEGLGLVKTLSYGRKKVVLSVNKYVEKEVWRGMKLLAPYIIDELRLSYSRASSNVDLVIKEMLEQLNVNIVPSRKLLLTVRKAIHEGLQRKPLPPWLKGIWGVKQMQERGMAMEIAKQHQPYPDTPYYGEVPTLAPFPD